MDNRREKNACAELPTESGGDEANRKLNGKMKNTYDTTEIHLRQTHNLFDNCKPTATVYKCLLCIETYQSDMAHQLSSLQWKKN